LKKNVWYVEYKHNSIMHTACAQSKYKNIINY